ncbi:acetamidase [Cucurbitaria berberidis CBS 394.84]|uniref:Acetamidase n=1 Tax=Cucurbitaria berberidis CBS 394.84 TaxID=1168544 RepID=A0A9P4L687_9PLEO|nr:acetamidase [Cucurbitaria berberidis CBS 394.84]KAF1842813.1 acetamidase [Cucurbitaria berberidis CBS 394.84]
MTISNTPQWLQTANTKRRLRDDLIQAFVETHKAHSEVRIPPISAKDSQIDDAKLLHLVGTGTTKGNAQDPLAIDSVEEILQAILSGVVTASQLLNAYIHRQTGTSPLTEVLFDNAIQQANELDEYFQNNGRLVGPLHGVPMTLKDQFDVQGYDSTLGYVGRAFKPATRDCALVSLLKEMGAIIVAKSNLPQSIMWCETENPLWGLTVHPRNPAFTPGGSTGGEGTLLSLRGTVIGWGTDIGAYNTRLPYRGVSVSTEGQEHVPSVIGPMTRNIESLIAVTKAVIERSPWDRDPKCCPVPWRPEIFEQARSRPLVVAVMRDDGVVRPHPPVTRVLEEVVAKLEKAGHEVVSWTPGSLHKECIEIMDQYYTADGGEDIQRDVEAGGEPFIPHVEVLVNRGKPISVYNYWQLNKQKIAAQERYLDLWNASKSPTGKQIDILLTPVMPHSAVPHRKCRWVGYTKVFNFVDYPAVVLPAGHVSKELDADAAQSMDSYQPRNAIDEWNWNVFDLEKMDGMPIGVQVVARRLQEEKALGAAQAIDKILRGSVEP